MLNGLSLAWGACSENVSCADGRRSSWQKKPTSPCPSWGILNAELAKLVWKPWSFYATCWMLVWTASCPRVWPANPAAFDRRGCRPGSRLRFSRSCVRWKRPWQPGRRRTEPLGYGRIVACLHCGKDRRQAPYVVCFLTKIDARRNLRRASIFLDQVNCMEGGA